VLAEKVEGEVVDSTGGPVAGAKIRLFMAKQGPDGATCKADDQGAFTARGLCPGKWRVLAFKAGFRYASMEVQVPGKGPVRLVLNPDPGFDVQVMDPQGNPLEGAHVALLAPSGGFIGSHRSGTTRQGGKIHLDGFPEEGGKALLEVDHPDYLKDQRTVT